MAYELSLKTILSSLSSLLKTDYVLTTNTIHRLIVVESNSMPTIAVSADKSIIVNESFWNKYIQNEDDLKTCLLHEMLHHVTDDVDYIKNINKDDPEIEVKKMALNLAMDSRINAFIYKSCSMDFNSKEFFTKTYDSFLNEGKESPSTQLFKKLVDILRPGNRPNDPILGKIYDFLYKDNNKDIYIQDFRDIYDLILPHVKEFCDKAQGEQPIIFIGSHEAEDDSSESGKDSNTTVIRIDRSENPDKDKASNESNQNEKPNSQPGMSKELEKLVIEHVRDVQAGSGGPLQSLILSEVFKTSQRIDSTIIKKIAFDNLFFNIRSEINKMSGKWVKSPVTSRMSRTDLVKLSRGYVPILWDSYKKKIEFKNRLSPIYLDLSGSVTSFLPKVINLVANIDKSLTYIWGFSTEVHKHTIKDLTSGKLITTGGTDLNCVLDHAKKNNYSRIVVLTDGFVGSISASHKDASWLKEVITILFGDEVTTTNWFTANYGKTQTLEEVTI